MKSIKINTYRWVVLTQKLILSLLPILLSINSFGGFYADFRTKSSVILQSPKIAFAAPDLITNLTGAAIITGGTTTTYNLTVGNVGNAASAGLITATLIVPNGMTYSSFLATGWSLVSTTLQNDGSYLLTFSYNTIIPMNGSSNNLAIEVMPSNTLPNGTNLYLTSNVSGGGETNTTNNVNNVSSTVNVPCGKTYCVPISTLKLKG